MLYITIVDPLYFIARSQSYKIKLFQKDKIEFHSLFVTMRTITKQTSLKSCLLEEFMMNLVFFGRKIFYSIDKEGQIWFQRDRLNLESMSTSYSSINFIREYKNVPNLIKFQIQ